MGPSPLLPVSGSVITGSPPGSASEWLHRIRHVLDPVVGLCPSFYITEDNTGLSFDLPP